MERPDALVQARESFARRAWRDAYATLARLDREEPLASDDLDLLAWAAHLAGEENACTEVLARLFHQRLDERDPAGAVRAAFWLGFLLMNRGEPARGGGWLGRAHGTLEEAGIEECVERGYLVLAAALQHLEQGDPAAAHELFTRVGAYGSRYRDPDLSALSRLGRGKSLIDRGNIAEGIVLLDEAMVAVADGEVSPLVSGIVYCAVIEACGQIFDLRRAQEWTAALSDWCASQPDLAPFRGECMVYRAELLRLHGAWPDALAEARVACQRLEGAPAEGMAFYQLAEIHRLRGEFGRAEEAYREASRAGRAPEPGLALLRLAQGQTSAAAAAIRRAMGEATGSLERARLLPASVEILLAMGDLASAREGAGELAATAAETGSPLLEAMSAQAEGAVLLAGGDAEAALPRLRSAWRAWTELDAPYEAARVRVQLARACQAVGDTDGCEMELDAARRVFERLGAAPDLEQLQASARKASAPGGLTAREVEVLRLVAAGKTNRAIAGEMVISEKTVARHVSNIFDKLDISSRAAATAYAYEHGLVDTRT